MAKNQEVRGLCLNPKEMLKIVLNQIAAEKSQGLHDSVDGSAPLLLLEN